MSNKTIEELVSDVRKLSDELIVASNAVQSARSTETALVNQINNTQRELDQMLSEMRKKAPMGTDWANSKITRVMVSP